MQPVSDKRLWQRPFTNKRYLHPPFSENIFTMWPEMRLICGDVIEKTAGYISAGLRVLVGEDMQSPDFTKVRYFVRPDGAPVHALQQDFEGYSIHMESFCDQQRVSTCYTRFTVKGTGEDAARVHLALLPRTGREDHLVGTEVDGYAQYDSNVHNWGFIPSGWKMEGDLLTDGDYQILLQGMEKLNPCWQGDGKGLMWYQRHLVKMDFTLHPGEEIAFDLCFRHGTIAPFDYEQEKEKTLAFWQGELKRLKKHPGGETGKYAEMVNNLVLQCLQMFSYPVGKDYVLPRQGGLQRVIWPNEGVEFLTALDRLGDFEHYTQTAYDTYFFTLQCVEGEEKGAVQNLSGNMWGSITGAACMGCARHTLFIDKEETFRRYSDRMYMAFEWMERQRMKTMDGSAKGVGIFPPMKSSDWPGEFQSWTFTDAFNLLGYEWMAKAFEHFRDARAPIVRAGYESYMACMKKILHDLTEESIFGDEMRLTFDLGVTMTDPPYGSYATDGPGMLIRAKVIDPGSREAKLIENYYRNRGMMDHGLTGMMNDGLIFQGHNADPWAGHTWYTSFSDLYWFYNWLESGERDKAEETLNAQMLYGMSPEYYLLERYADNDPYWTPWMPNASANGRLLMMLTDYFSERTQYGFSRKEDVSIDLTGIKVKHAMFGVGVIIEAAEDYVIVQFATKNSKFVYPDAFEKFICAVEVDNQKLIMDQIKKRREIDEQKKKEAIEEAQKKEQIKTLNVPKELKRKKDIDALFAPDYHVEKLVRQPILTYQQVEEQFGIRISGFGRGINPTENAVVLISSIAKSGGKFVYHDRWTNDGDYIYSGEGKSGNQKLTNGNLAIQKAADQGKDIHLFVKFSPKEYYYQGIFELVDYSYEDERDEDGDIRKEYRFRLRKVEV